MPDDDVIKMKMPQSPPALAGQPPTGDDLVWFWDVSTSVLRKAPISTLPFTDGVGGPTTVLGSPFHVRTGYTNIAQVGDDTVITDARLIGKNDYVVSTTQGAVGEFNDDQLVYDQDAGTVTILGFALDLDEKITIYADGVVDASLPTGLAALTDRITALEAILTPFIPTILGPVSGRVWWAGTAAIPVGWQEDTAMRGFLPMHQDTAQLEFKTLNQTGGAKNHTNTLAEMPPHVHKTSTAPTSAGSRWPFKNGPGYNTSDEDTSSAGGVSGSAQAWNIMNPYKVGRWIKYVG